MAKIFLTYWEERQPGGRWVMHKPGEEVTVTGDVLARLERIGAVGESAPVPVSRPIVAPSTTQVEAAVSTSDRPLKTARLEAWQAYAQSVGVSTTGKSKAEIIAAVG